jgi:hypothetical protein
MDIQAFLKTAYDAVMHRDYRLLAATILIGFVAVARKYGARVPGKVGAFVASDRGGAVLALGLALIGGAANALLAAQPLSLAMVGSAMYVAVLAAGGYALVKKADLMGLAKVVLSRGGAALVLILALGTGGCAWLAAHPTVAAALKCTEDLVLAALVDVGAAFSSGSVDWGAIGHAEEVHGLDAVICAAQRLANPSPGAAVNVKVAKGASAYLAARGLK